jgi:hypothetical protein
MRDKYIESLKVSVCLVKFKKKDGSLRKMYCTLKEDMMNFPDSPLKKVLTESPTKNIVVWDIENKGWRSFNPETVILVKSLETHEGGYDHHIAGKKSKPEGFVINTKHEGKEEPSRLVNRAEFAKANLLKTKKFGDK